METLRVDVSYRPLKIAWAIESSDKPSFRHAVKLTHTLWGGRFNPIILVDRPKAASVIETFRPDVVLPIGESSRLATFVSNFPHLITPFMMQELHHKRKGQTTRAAVLDIQNAISHLRHTPAWRTYTEGGFPVFKWKPDDPLADLLLIQYGAYPDGQDIGIDYIKILSGAAEVRDVLLDVEAPLSPDTLSRPSIARLSRYGLQRHYSIRAFDNDPGFFAGDSSNIDDLVYFWNLCAADKKLQFVDLNYPHRHALIRQAYSKWILSQPALYENSRRHTPVWCRDDNLTAMLDAFKGEHVYERKIFSDDGVGATIIVPTMSFGGESTLGVLGLREGKTPATSFALNDKPISTESLFFTQHLVASISFIGSLYGDEQHTLVPPYIPELNEFLSRSMCIEYSKLRVEPESVGLIIRATDHDLSLKAQSNQALITKIFDIAGFNARMSDGGLVARQLISRLNGINGAQVFQISGVRRLVKTYGPMQSFTKKSALQIIGAGDPNDSESSFEQNQNLYIEAREPSKKLTPSMVFSYLVERGLFRIGAELECPACALSSWIALDVLQQVNSCPMCGDKFDATRQIVDGVLRFRRTGVLGIEKNVRGAVPTALVLQQLSHHVEDIFKDKIYSTSYDLASRISTGTPKCEIDFIMIVPQTYPRLPQIIIGECKDSGGKIDANDIDILKRVADAMPARRFETFIVLAKLSAFGQEEIALAGALRASGQRNVILLSNKELESDSLYDRVNKERGLDLRGGTAEDLVENTTKLYFPRDTSKEIRT